MIWTPVWLSFFNSAHSEQKWSNNENDQPYLVALKATTIADMPENNILLQRCNLS